MAGCMKKLFNLLPNEIGVIDMLCQVVPQTDKVTV